MSRILLVDDEAEVAATTARLLARAGHDVQLADSGAGAIAAVGLRQPDLMILDYDMPDMDAPEVLDELSKGGRNAGFPVIVLTGARLSPADQVLALDRGAADYVMKGVNNQVLLARVRAALRTDSAAILRRGRLRIDMLESRAWLDERLLDLDRKPLAALNHMARHEGVAFSRLDLLKAVWDTDFPGFEHTVEQAVYSIRRSLREPGWIETVHGLGYRFRTLG